MGDITIHYDAFECPHCSTLNERTLKWKGIETCTCTGCGRMFYVKTEIKKAFIGMKNKPIKE